MDKDELKNRISLALTDPILQQGFEIICKENAQWKQSNKTLKDALKHAKKDGDDLEKSYKEIAELKVKIGLSIDCEKAQKNGELCLGYGGDEDEPCERCKNCIKCECGYYQLGETKKDEQLTEVQDIIKKLVSEYYDFCKLHGFPPDCDCLNRAEQFLKEIE